MPQRRSEIVASLARLNPTPSLDEPSATYDGALYLASHVCGASPSKTAIIYTTTKTGVADPRTGELYLVLTAENPVGRHLREDEEWREIARFTFTGGR